jgi:heat shock protein HslJ
MNQKTLGAVILLVIAVLALAVWLSQRRETGLQDDPAGTYIAFLAGPAASGQAITLYLGASTSQTAVMVRDYQDGTSPSVDRGSWRHEGGGTIGVMLGNEPRLLFSLEGDTLSLWDPDQDEWGIGGLELMPAAIPLDSEWMWSKTIRKDATVAPEPDSPFILRLEPDLRLTAKGDCNDMAGDLALREGGKIIIGPLVSTKVFCEGSLEPEFLDALSSAQAYSIVDDTLILILKNDEGSMEFARYHGVPIR